MNCDVNIIVSKFPFFFSRNALTRLDVTYLWDCLVGVKSLFVRTPIFLGQYGVNWQHFIVITCYCSWGPTSKIATWRWTDRPTMMVLMMMIFFFRFFRWLTWITFSGVHETNAFRWSSRSDFPTVCLCSVEENFTTGRMCSSVLRWNKTTRGPSKEWKTLASALQLHRTRFHYI